MLAIKVVLADVIKRSFPMDGSGSSLSVMRKMRLEAVFGALIMKISYAIHSRLNAG